MKISINTFTPALLLAVPLACGGGDTEPANTGTDSDGSGGATASDTPIDGDGGGDGDGSGGTGADGTGASGTGAAPGTGGADPGTGGGGGTISGICPAGSEALSLTLDGVSLAPVSGVTNNYQGWGNFEGPVWIGDALYYSNISGGGNPPPAVIWKLVPGATAEIVVNDSGSNGLATDGTKLFAAMHSDGSVSTRDLSNITTATPIATTYGPESKRFNSPNDLIVANDGSVYFTDPTWQAPSPNPQPSARAYHVVAGAATPVGVEGQPSNPNGITLSPDEASLFIGGTNGLYRYTRNSDGSIGTGAQITTANIGAADGIDGLGRDCAGNIYVAVHSKKLVVVLSPAGAEVGSLTVPGGEGVTNVAFGGADKMTIFVTSLGATPTIHSAQLNVPGYPY